MKKWTLAFSLGACTAAMAIGACSQATTPAAGDQGGGTTDGAGGSATTSPAAGGSAPGTSTTTPGAGGTGTTSTTGQGGTGSTTTTTTSSGQGGTGSTTSSTSCHAPTSLHPPKAGSPSIFCPFSAVDGGKNEYCEAQTQHCCEPKSGSSTCEPSGTPCDAADTDWQCEDPVADCPQGQMCCGIGTFMQAADPACANYAKGFKGTHCAASCVAGEVPLCTDDSECGGKTCKPMYTKGNQVGACD